MKYISFEHADHRMVSALVPPELLPGISKNEIAGGVAEFAGDACGAVAWNKHQKDSVGMIRSIYVRPEDRRLGVGTFLMVNAVREMGKKKCEGIRFTYSEYGERTALTPFFNEIGYETEVSLVPLGKKTLWELNEAMEKKGITKLAGDASCLYEMEKTERVRIREELYAVSGQDMDYYDKELPGTYVVTDGDNIKAALFVSEEPSGNISLDYLYGNGSPKDIASIMKTAVMRLLTHYDRDTVCEMLLATEAGKNLYTGMFQKPNFAYRIAECDQPFGYL